MKKILTMIAMISLVVPGTFSKNRVDAGGSYPETVRQTASMVSDDTAQSMAVKHGLNILNVTWEDTGRYKGSSVGPNISDMTIQVQQQDPKTKLYNLTCMPVIRYPNFEDRSADIDPEKFYLLVGNEKGKQLRRITLKEYLKNIRKYMSKPKSWKGNRKSLLAKRDTHVLVSAQACFLPVPKNGMAEFNPVLFNYSSYQGDPGVLAILATREGTSMTVIDNTRDAFEAGTTWGQRLFFNQKGERTSLTGKRLSDFLADESQKKTKKGAKHQSVEAAKEQGLNMVLLIQVPLKQKNIILYSPMAMDECEKAAAPSTKRSSDVEQAVIGHGKVEGPFTEVDDLDIERDDRYPIRVTVQFYKATSNGIVSGDDMTEIAAQINRVYRQADYVGSLVVDGDTGRPTEHQGPKFEPPDWWEKFWKRHQDNTGLTPEQTISMLRKLYGPNWSPRNESDFEKEVKKLENNKK